jgi:IS605 OrfB family transposase
MQLTYVLELLKPTKRKENIFLNNIAEVVKNRQTIAAKLKAGETKLSSADFKEINLPAAVKNQNIREVKALHKLFLKSGSDKDNIEFKANQPICYNNQNYKIDHHIISIPLYTTKCQRFVFPVKQTERFEKLQQHIDSGCKLGKASLFHKRGKWYFAVTIKIAVKKNTNSNLMGIDIGLRQQVGTIIMENLDNIRNTAKSLNRANRNIHSWTFYQLQQFIKYKAELAGIKVEYINPKYTSQGCSKCAKVKKSNRKANLYSCECGNHIHADLNAGRNIANKYLEQQSA